MKKLTRIFAVMMALALALAFTACKKEEPAPEPDDGQNPVMNFIGDYVNGRADILIEADGDTGAKATVTWGSSAATQAVWTMSGDFNIDTHEFTYSNGVKKEVTYSEDGSVAEEKELYTDGTGTMTFTEGNEGPYLEWKDDKENIADGLTFTYNAGGGSQQTGMANPWSDVDSAEAAAEGAGIDGFTVPEGLEISLGTIKVGQYRCMEGMAEARIPIAAVDMTIRKGTKAGEMAEGDISGDYGEYKYDWTVNVGDIEVKCFGNREGEATKTIWSVGEYDYSISAFGEGGDTDYGLPADDVTALVEAVK